MDQQLIAAMQDQIRAIIVDYSLEGLKAFYIAAKEIYCTKLNEGISKAQYEAEQHAKEVVRWDLKFKELSKELVSLIS